MRIGLLVSDLWTSTEWPLQIEYNNYYERSYAGAKIHSKILNVTQIIQSFNMNMYFTSGFSKRMCCVCVCACPQTRFECRDSKRENLRGTHVIQLPTCNTIKVAAAVNMTMTTTTTTMSMSCLFIYFFLFGPRSRCRLSNRFKLNGRNGITINIFRWDQIQDNLFANSNRLIQILIECLWCLVCTTVYSVHCRYLSDYGAQNMREYFETG